jgi:hypothetical protein
MLSEKTLAELQQILQELMPKLTKLAKETAGERKYDYPMMPPEELTKALNSKISPKKKKKLLLTQIGYVRINLFSEYYERTQRARKKNQLDKAAKLMNEYTETISIPYIITKKKPTLTERLKMALTKTKPIEPTEQINKWRNNYQEWLKQTQEAPARTDEKKRTEQFEELKTSFITLYTISFNPKDFPPLRLKPSELD